MEIRLALVEKNPNMIIKNGIHLSAKTAAPHAREIQDRNPSLSIRCRWHTFDVTEITLKYANFGSDTYWIEQRRVGKDGRKYWAAGRNNLTIISQLDSDATRENIETVFRRHVTEAITKAETVSSLKCKKAGFTKGS